MPVVLKVFCWKLGTLVDSYYFAGAEKIVQILIGRGAKIHIKNSEEATPLHMAASTTGGKFNLRIEHKVKDILSG